jgi:hypothetical protein
MTDQNQLLRDTLRMVDSAVYIDDSGRPCLNSTFDDEMLQAALSHPAQPAPAQPQGAGEAVAVVRVQHGYWSRGHFHESKRWHAVGLPALENLPDGTKLYTTPPASQQAAQAVPDGWQLVPIEPTPEMTAAGMEALFNRGPVKKPWDDYVAEMFAAMLRAAKGEQ